MGVTRYVVEDLLQEEQYKEKYKDRGCIVITVFQPFDGRLTKFLEENGDRIQKLCFVEMNHSGQLQRLVTEQCKLSHPRWEGKLTHHRKYTLYPIFKEEL